MKRLIYVFIAILLLLPLAACSENSEKPSGSIDEINSGGVQGSTENPGNNSDAADFGQATVETKSDRVVTTSDDGLGTTAVTEYIYKNDVLTEIIMTMQCTDTAAAKNLLNSYTTGDLKEYAAQLYSDMKQDGKNVVFTYNEGQIAAFENLGIEQLAAVLNGGDPFSGSNSGNIGDETNGDTKINTAWSDLPLPEDFPQLADGVTECSTMEGGYCSLTWNAMSKSDAETIISKLESWIGMMGEKYEMDGTIQWDAANGTYNVSFSYCPDTFGGTMPQVTISIIKFE